MARGRKNDMETVNRRLDFVLSLMVQFLPALKALEQYEYWTENEYTEALSREQFYADQKAVFKRCKKDAENEDLSEQHAFFIKALEFNVSENYKGNQSQSATNAIAQIAKLKGLVKEETKQLPTVIIVMPEKKKEIEKADFEIIDPKQLSNDDE